ncbi:Golgi transport complex subunit COG7 KNAG_0D03470 [Huiozyma naganishii CBS 8797]|uniref:Uncharacterized protein n=1 Tax=Huiozyma naganishii (strain ATCC MYA-139 / BCRC 22969 / CBS 8797 / KCTC 17520 / NBRC 10181 / NCYC 3082 / Yp74L-3) TaxID=1071383 RepID=J7S5Z2_HUIN7|nr:hypothetical protein KNAG_0D03470 [Kazachstania naganishii CBS 8797]CCK70094.1 hypothetical protein KNAG_0D03470 [Kazachstania naganishii CBS 8797]
MSHNKDTESNIKRQDELLDMFFDENFVPQAFVDILLSSTKSDDFGQLRTMSTSLLARLDFYTKSLTSRLENTIWNLEKLSETLPGTWINTSGKEESRSKENTLNSLVGAKSNSPAESYGVSKLEYYLDTLGSSVKALKTDLSKIENDLDQMNEISHEGEAVLGKLRALGLVKARLDNVLHVFMRLKSILIISEGNPVEASIKDALPNVSSRDFELSLQTLAEAITQSLKESLEKEKNDQLNRELLTKIDNFSELEPVFKGLQPFYDLYSEFANTIERNAQSYLRQKDIVGEFGI